jgi:hypothetical protein
MISPGIVIPPSITIVSGIQPGIGPAIIVESITHAIINIDIHAGGVITPPGISRVIVVLIKISILFTTFLDFLVRVTIIAVNIRKYLILHDLVDILRFFAKVVAINAVIILYPGWRPRFRCPGHCNPFRAISIDSIVIIIGSLLVRTTGNQYNAQ